MTRPTTSQLVSAAARCQRCAWSCDARNAQALGAQHHDQKRHPVVIDKHERITYGAASGPAMPEDARLF
jgi:hypothetical protein